MAGKKAVTQEKIKVESEYHEITNGGHMTEIKSKNVYGTLKKVSESEIGYVKIINVVLLILY